MVIHVGILAVMLLFTVGLWTRVTSVLAWMGAMQYVQRLPTSMFGMDTMMIILLLYLMIGNSGAGAVGGPLAGAAPRGASGAGGPTWR